MAPLLLAAALLAQPAEPGRLPANLAGVPPGYQMAEGPPRPADSRPDPAVQLPQPENLARVDSTHLTLRQVGASWQVWAGGTLVRDFGGRAKEAQEMLGLLRDLRPTHWASVGAPRRVVDYGLDRGESPPRRVYGRGQIPVDGPSVRVEQVQRAWVLADKNNLLLSFGTDRAGAEQAAAAVRRYGFNRLATVGAPEPAAAVLFTSEEAAPAVPPAHAALQRASQEMAITRGALDVPGVGAVGERILLRPGLMKVSREAGVWTLSQGADAVATFGPSGEFAARDAARAISDGRYTEFGRVGGLTFFLSNGQAPKRVPFGATLTPFDPTRARPAEVNGAWALTDSTGRPLFPAADRAEAELMARVVQAYGFDAVARIGSSPRDTLRYATKSGR